MGALTSRQNAGVEEIDVGSNHAYKYPPRSGNYFGSHFIMGGERFDTPQPESYLFGENSDLNFLGSRPTSFPYPPPQANEPTKTLKSLVNIRKESIRFVRAPPDFNKIDGDHNERDVETGKGTLFNIEFTFDCDVRCAITIYYFCIEEVSSTGVTYVPRDPSMNSETFHYKRGANQQFCQMSHVFDPSKYTEEELLYNTEKEVMPIAIHCVAEEGSEEMRQSHTTITIVEKHSDGSYVMKALKQKLFVDGLCYLLQEIYGIENKNLDKITTDDENEDNGSECVICMSDVRDTLILPCRHLCLCNSCAESLRYQANNCPICRAPFRALLQIRALQKSASVVQPVTNSPPDGNCENIPPGYEAVSLIEALNGPCVPRQPPVAAVQDMVETPDTETSVQAAEILNRPDNQTPTKGGKDGDKRERNSSVSNTPEFRMSVLLSRDEECKETQKSPLLADQSPYSRSNKLSRPRDSVKHVNEKNASLEKDETQDDDSEAEKLSPLLHNKDLGQEGPLALDMAGVVEPIDDTDTEHEDLSAAEKTNTIKNNKTVGSRNPRLDNSDGSPPPIDDSEFYATEDVITVPAPLGPLYSSDTSSTRGPSLPGTPLSHVSTRSSADSYGSGSSTRHLLAIKGTDRNNTQI